MQTTTQYTLDPRRRLVQHRANAAIAKFSIIGVILGVLGVTGVNFVAFVSGYVNEVLIVSAIYSGAVLVFCAWLFTYSITALPSKQLRNKSGNQTQSPVNVAEIFDFALMEMLRRSYWRGRTSELRDFIAVVCNSSAGQKVFERLQVSAEDALAQITSAVLPNLTWMEFTRALHENSSGELVTVLDVLGVLLRHPQMRTWIRRNDLQEEDIAFVLWWQNAMRAAVKQKKRWWTPENLLDFTGVGISWAAGYTPLVDRFVRPPRGSAWDVGLMHGKQVDALTQALARSGQSNVLLVGQPGVGRIGVVREFMRRVSTGTTHPSLVSQRVLYMNITQLVGLGGSYQEQLTLVSRALQEMERAGNIIVVLDGLSSLLQPGSNMNFSDILAPFFSSSLVRVVAVMSLGDYRERVARNSELERLFEVVEVPALSPEDTLKLLALSSELWERNQNAYLPYRALESIVESTQSILPQIPFPEKAFDILDEVVVDVTSRKEQVVTPEDVYAVISRKTGVDFGKMTQGESNKLLTLADYIHKRVVNQHEGVEAVSRAIVRARAGVHSRKRPIGTFLFLGPTGVGKTETAKALAEAYFGSEEYLKRLDMSEFQHEDAISRLIGTPQGATGRLTNLVAEHPFAVILLDEFEKASVAVQELFLPLLDEGYIVDATGRQYSFIHSVIIATSNAGSELIRENITQDAKLPAEFDMKLREHILGQGIFLPELMNRFDGVITFTPLSQEHIAQVAEKMLQRLNAELDAKHGITIVIDPSLIKYLASAGYDPEFGARPMRRLIQDSIEYWVAQQLLTGGVQPGQQLRIPIEQFQKA